MAEIYYQLSQSQTGKILKVKDAYEGQNVSVDMNDFYTAGIISQAELNSITLDNFIYDIVELDATISGLLSYYIISTNQISRGNGISLSYNSSTKVLSIAFSQILMQGGGLVTEDITPTVNVYCVIKP